MVVVLRSLAFNLFYFLWAFGVGILMLPVLLLPRQHIRGAIRFWLQGLITGARLLCGIRWRVEGRENLPDGPCILAVKHQSAWETFFFHTLLPDPVYVLKKELLSIPVLGWYMSKTRMIAVDRDAGASALKHMLRLAEPAMEEGRQLIIFPEGTRVSPGDEKPWQPGIAALYSRLGDRVPVIPVALNSGMFWPRNSFLRRPGEVVVRLMPALPGGMGKKECVEQLRRQIEQATGDLCQLTGQRQED